MFLLYFIYLLSFFFEKQQVFSFGRKSSISKVCLVSFVLSLAALSCQFLAGYKLLFHVSVFAWDLTLRTDSFTCCQTLYFPFYCFAFSWPLRVQPIPSWQWTVTKLLCVFVLDSMLHTGSSTCTQTLYFSFLPLTFFCGGCLVLSISCCLHNST